MSGKILRVGVAGYGRSGCDIHTAWLRQDAGRFQIAAVSDQMPERRAEARRDFGCAVFNDYRKLIAQAKKLNLDLFVNALPSNLHSVGTVAALRAGLHVVSEKPQGRRVTEFDAMLAAARKAKKAYMPFQNSRFYPFFRKMIEVIDSGVMGRVVHVRTIWGGYARRWDWQTKQEYYGGNLLNTGPHPMDHAIVLFGKKMPKVFCRMNAIHPSGGDAENFCDVTLYGGLQDPVIQVHLNSFLAYPPADMYTVSCEFGGLAGGPAELRWKYFDPAKAPRQKLMRAWSDKRKYCGEELPWVEKTWKAPEKAISNAFQFLSRTFYDNVYDVIVNGAKPVIGLDEVRRQIAAIEACHKQNPLPKRRKN